MSLNVNAPMLKQLALKHYLKQNWSACLEFALVKHGRHRADVYLTDTRGDTLLLEIKSSLRDFTSDRKFSYYREYADRCYVAAHSSYAEKIEDRFDPDTGFGLVQLDPFKVLVRCRRIELDADRRMSMLARMAWKGNLNRRNHRV